MGCRTYLLPWELKLSRCCNLNQKGLDCVIHSQIVDTSGRYIVVKAAIKDKMYVFVNIYAPNKDEDIIKLHSRKLNKFLRSRIVLLLKHMLRHFNTKFLTPFFTLMLNFTKLTLK